MSAGAESVYHVLEFAIGGKQYSVELEHVDEIVTNDATITAIPTADEAVDGVVDLRGRTTTVVDPRIPLDLSTDASTKYVIVFESDDHPIGWRIEDVHQVESIPIDQLDETVAAGPVAGVFKTGDEFTVLVDPRPIND